MRTTDPIDSKGLLLERGISYLDAKQTSAAISTFQRALQLDPQSAGAYSGIGQAFLDMEEFEGAKVAFSKSVELAPTADRYILLGFAHARLGDLRMAFRAYKNALRLAPENSEALFNMASIVRETHPTVAVSLFHKAIHANPNGVEAYLELGALLNRCRRFEDAKRILEKAIQVEADDVWIWVELGNALWRLGQHEPAEVVFRSAANKFTSASAPLWSLALYLETVNRVHDARILLKKAAERDPGDPVAESVKAEFQERHPEQFWRDT